MSALRPLPIPRVVRSSTLLQTLALRAAEVHSPHTPILDAAAAGRIALVCFDHPQAAWPHRAVEALRIPAVAWISDDLGAIRRPTPPSEWRCAPHLRKWCEAALCHGTGAEREHYRQAVEAALVMERFALIDTSGAMASTWGHYLAERKDRAGGIMVLLPTPGTSHPLSREALN